MKRFATPSSGGGWHAIRYSLAMGRKVGFRSLWRAMHTRNACKTCALGMGGQLGGMRNEAGHWPEVCKKSLQAMVADMQGRIEDRFFDQYAVDHLKRFSPRELEAAGRLVRPLLRRAGESHFRPVTWDEALRRITDKLRATAPEEAFFYFSGRSSNEAAFLLQLMARVWGTNHINNCSYYCHQASGVGLSGSVGTGTATVNLDDLEHADLFFLIGGNPASNHPRLMASLMRMRRRGGRVIVINPVRETGLVRFRVPSDVRSLLFGSEIASEYVQVNIGGDMALLAGIAKLLVESDHVDRAFIDSATTGFDELQKLVQGLDFGELERVAGVSRATMEHLAQVYRKARHAIFGWTMGITHHVHGVQNVQWIVNLALLRGMAGRPRAGLLPIRGHSNVQGIGSVGVTPALKKEIFERFQAAGIPVPAHAGLDTLGCMEAAHAGRMRFALALGGNLYGSNPEAGFASEALSRVDQVVYLSTSLNTGHVHGCGRETIILPVLARDEEPYLTTQESMFSYIRLSDGGPARHEGPRGEVDIIADIAGPLLGDKGGIAWSALRSTAAIRAQIARLVPGFEQVEGMEQTRREFEIPGRILHAGRFPTADGRARFFAHSPLTARQAEPDSGAFNLMTVRSEGQFNSVVYEDYDYYRGQERRDVILMHPDDMRDRGLAEDDLVTVRSGVGAMANIVVRPFSVRRGNVVMYYPEANVLVPRVADPGSRTPSFKSVIVTISRNHDHPAGTGLNDARAMARPGFWRRYWHRYWAKRRRPQLKSC